MSQRPFAGVYRSLSSHLISLPHYLTSQNRKYAAYIFDGKRTFADSRVIVPFREFVEHCLSHTAPTDGNSWYCPQQYHPILSSDYWVPDMMLQPKLQKAAFAWMAQIGAGPGLHLDVVDNILCHIRGEKRVQLVHPEDTKFCYPRLEGAQNFSQITDVDDTELIASKFPLFQRARRFETVLNAGDALFIPANWWHETWAVTPFSIGVNFFFNTAGGAEFGVPIEEYDMLGQLFIEKFKKMCPVVRDQLVRLLDATNFALSSESAGDAPSGSPCTKG